MIKASRLMWVLLSVVVSVLSAECSYAQGIAKCEICVNIACEGLLQGKCIPGGSTTCTVSGTGCEQQCFEGIFCHRPASVAATSLAPSGDSLEGCKTPFRSVKEVSAYIKQQSADDKSAVEDEEIRGKVIQAGGSAARILPQLKGPISIIWAEHASKDMLPSAQILNLSDKPVTAIRVGWTIKSPNEPDEVKVGEWSKLETELAPEEAAMIGAQNLDTAPLWKVGTIVRIYIEEVRFKDGSVWQRKSTRTSPANMTSSTVSEKAGGGSGI